MEDTKLLDFADYPEIAIDGIGDMQFVNRQAYVSLFQWRRIDAIWRPVVVAVIKAPANMINSPASTIPLIAKALASIPQEGFNLLN